MAGNKIKKEKAYFSISAVAKMFSVHQQTIRLYEKEGLIVPKRSEGNTRLFSETDVDRLEEIIYLTNKLGINLAGVEMILKLQKKIKKMQADMNKMFIDAQDELEEETNVKKAEIKNYTKLLIDSKQKALESTNEQDKNRETQSEDIIFRDWDIDYSE
jgi:MerR family transcriptional regulator/heat shock protein HspR